MFGVTIADEYQKENQQNPNGSKSERKTLIFARAAKLDHAETILRTALSVIGPNRKSRGISNAADHLNLTSSQKRPPGIT